MKRFYVYKFILDDTIVIDTVEKKWVFYNTNMWNQFHNLDEPFKKVTKSRINGFMKRLGSSQRYYRSDGYAVDKYIYAYFLTDEQRALVKCNLELREWDFITSGDDLSEVLLFMCENAILKSPAPESIDTNYYKKKLAALV